MLVLLYFGGSFAAKYISMNYQPSMARLMLIDFNPDELHYYPFIISLDKCDVSSSAVEHAFDRIFVLYKTEDVNLKVFKLIKG